MSDEFAIPSLPQKKAAETTPVRAPPPLQYEKPTWGGVATFKYRLEVLKDGASLETIHGPKKDFVTIGRLPICDIPMEHPSISRYQAIIQFDKEGDAYIYDMGSKPIPAREHVCLKPGDQLRFGESTRICIFDSDKPYDPEAEAEERKQAILQQRIAKARGEDSNASQGDDQGISWGFAEDAEQVEEEEEDDGTEMNAEDIEADLNKSGDASLLNVEAEKMALEDLKRRRQDLEIMYGDDSDEELYDKTKKRSKKVAKAETHDELVIKEKKTALDIEILERELEEKKKRDEEAKAKAAEEEDLDSYMSSLSKKPKSEKSLFALQKELTQLRKVKEIMSLIIPSELN
ncbi:unnamed protein product [Mucor hiemalis]